MTLIKQSSTLFLKILIFLMGLGVAGFALIVIPEEIDLVSEGFNLFTAMLAVGYLSLIPFYFAVYQTWKLLNYIDENRAFSDLSVKALKNIKYSAIAFSLLFLILLPIFFMAAQSEDAPGVGVIGLVFVFAPGVIATFAAILQRLLQEAISIKSENDLTV